MLECVFKKMSWGRVIFFVLRSLRKCSASLWSGTKDGSSLQRTVVSVWAFESLDRVSPLLLPRAASPLVDTEKMEWDRHYPLVTWLYDICIRKILFCILILIRVPSNDKTSANEILWGVCLFQHDRRFQFACSRFGLWIMPFTDVAQALDSYNSSISHGVGYTAWRSHISCLFRQEPIVLRLVALRTFKSFTKYKHFWFVFFYETPPGKKLLVSFS